MPQRVLRTYVRLLLGDRRQETLVPVLRIKRQAVGMILNGERKVMPEHLDRISTAWRISSSRMFADMAKIALNLEMGLPAGEGIGGMVLSAESGAEPSPPPRTA